MQQEVIVPWSPGAAADPFRTRALGWTLRQWSDAGYWPLMAMGCQSGWSKAEAVAAAVSRAGPVVLLADADCFVAREAVAQSVQAVRDGAAWSIPHGRVLRLTDEATVALIVGDPQPLHPFEREPYVGRGGGGIVAVRRDVALDCSMDSTFRDWGGEDESWGFALATLWEDPHRPNPQPDKGWPLTHLYHPQPHKPTLWGSHENEARRRRYWEAYMGRDRDTMRELVEEGRPASWASNV